MSRQTATKGRNDKGKTTSAPTPAITHDIVPGKFTDQDWHLMLDHDDEDDFLTDIVEEVCSSAMDIIFQKYLERQLIPYIVLQAKDAILQITEWQFLFKDEGEKNIESDPAWIQDEEPPPAITDCWAQGSVPCRIATPVSSRPPTVLEDISEEQTAETNDVAQDTQDKLSEYPNQENMTNEQESATPNEQVTGEEVNQEEGKHKESSSSASRKAEEREKLHRKKKFMPYRGNLGSAHISKITDSLDQSEMEMLIAELFPLNAQSPDPDSLQMPNSCHSLLKLQAGRPPAQRDVTYDNTGSVTMLRKINPAKLPSHRVKTGFQIMDPSSEAAKARLDAMRIGRSINAKVPQPPKSQPPSLSSRSRPRPKALASQNSSNEPAPIASSMLPQLLEIMELSPGVTLKEGERTKKGPKPYSRSAELKQEGDRYTLRPVSMKMNNTRITVQDLLDRQSPTIRPLTESPPIPPIQPHPPSQAVQ